MPTPGSVCLFILGALIGGFLVDCNQFFLTTAVPLWPSSRVLNQPLTLDRDGTSGRTRPTYKGSARLLKLTCPSVAQGYRCFNLFRCAPW